jgi:hypothetical protein
MNELWNLIPLPHSWHQFIPDLPSVFLITGEFLLPHAIFEGCADDEEEDDDKAARNIHAHPTLSEVLAEAAEGRAIHG